LTSPLGAGTAARLSRSRSCAHIPAAAKQFFGPSLPVMLRSALLNVMIKAAQKAARALKRDFGEVEHLQVSLKGPANFVSAADHRAEQTLREELERARPGYSFLGEEGGRYEGTDKTHCWIVDPLDGTLNFLHSIPHFAISIALERESAIVAGIVYNPVTDELFTAERGKGAFLNDRRIRVASRKRLADSVIACALPHPSRGDAVLARHEHSAVQERVAGLRRFGAAALDLAWVAAGRVDGYWERGLAPWDMAAGIALVREAGGFVTDLSGREIALTSDSILAGNEPLHRDLLRLLGPSARPAAAVAG
jgi:myo-inositol-1(or 4)-monophosphatase